MAENDGNRGPVSRGGIGRYPIFAVGAVLLPAGVVDGAVVLLVAGTTCAGWVCELLAPVAPCVAAGRPASAKPSAVPPAASTKARASTIGSTAVRRRGGRGSGAGV